MVLLYVIIDDNEGEEASRICSISQNYGVINFSVPTSAGSVACSSLLCLPIFHIKRAVFKAYLMFTYSLLKNRLYIL